MRTHTFQCFKDWGLISQKLILLLKKNLKVPSFSIPMNLIPKPPESEQKINRELRIELVNHLRMYLKEFDQQTYGEIYKLFQSVDLMRDNLRSYEISSRKIKFESLIKEIEDKVDKFTNSFLTLVNN